MTGTEERSEYRGSNGRPEDGSPAEDMRGALRSSYDSSQSMAPDGADRTECQVFDPAKQ